MSEYENIPDLLKSREQWLYWNARNDRPRAPLDAPAARYGCSWSDPETWMAYDELVEDAETNENVGIGYVNAADNDDYPRGIIGSIDIDGVAVEPHGSPKDWLPSLQPFFDADAYIEWSPSGEGLRIPIAGIEVPEWWTDQHFSAEEHEGVEVLTNKFSTYTGDQLRGSGSEVADYGDWLDEWLREVYKAITGEDPLESREEAIADAVGDEDSGQYDSDEEWFTADVAEEAVEHVDPDATYSVWRDVGMALTNCFGSQGERLFEQWSKGGSKWDSEAQQQADRIENDASNYNYDAGTIIHYAKEGGWNASAAARQQLLSRSDGGTVASSDASTAEPGDGPSASRTNDVYLCPQEVLQRAIDDPLSSIYINDEGEIVGSVQQLSTHQLAHYVWDIAQDAGEGDVLAVEKGPIYAYDDGVWRDDDEQHLRTIGSDALDSMYRKSVRNELEERVRTDNIKHADELGAPDGTLATEGGLLDLKSRDLQPLQPEHYAVAKIATEPDFQADCPKWESFLEDSIPDEEQRLKFQEYAGYVLWHHRQTFGKALFLVGPTDSGKGTALKTIRSVVGKDNLAAESLRNLIDSRWGTSSLIGNIANIRNEVSPRGLKNVEAFKELTGGEDEIDAEFKGQQKFKFVVTQKFLFATNQVPSIEDAGEAFYNRLLFVEFPNTVPRTEQDKDLDDKLEAESSGILNWMLDGLDRLLEQGHFTGERSINGKKQICDAFGGVIDRFTYEALMITGDTDDVVVKSDLENLAQEFAEDIDKNPEWDTQTAFTNQIKNQAGVRQGQKKIDGKNYKVFKGIRVKPEVVYRYGADIKAVTSDRDEPVSTGLNEYGDDVRPGYDMRAEDEETTVEEPDDVSDGSYVQRVTETVATAQEPLGVAQIVQQTEGEPGQLRVAIEKAAKLGRIDRAGDDQYEA